MKTIMDMAFEAGFTERELIRAVDCLVAFAAIVCADEREACAKVCELLPPEWPDQDGIAQAENATMMDCAAAIRARGNT